MAYTIALAGNPNCGKTTLFNELTGSKQHVGNWPGVTVDKKDGTYKKDKNVTILDLPGTYSLSPYSAEEIVARDYIVKERQDAVINIVDGTSMERNLYLTIQILETQIPTVVAINMMDEVEAKGDKIDFRKLSEKFGVPVVPIQARNGKGLTELMGAATEAAKAHNRPKPLQLFDKDIENSIEAIKQMLVSGTDDEKEWKAIKLVEGDEIVQETLTKQEKPRVSQILARLDEVCEDSEARVADLRYQYIGKVIKDAVKKKNNDHVETRSDKLDKILTNRILALPIFALVMYLIFACTFSENFLFIPEFPSPGVWLQSLVETGWGAITDGLNNLLSNAGASEWILSLVIDGILEGVGAVASFLPLVLVLFLLLSFLEDSGYMARVAFVMDRLFRRFGLSGKSFIPLLMGFGCSVPALMASRTLDSDKDRKITMMITPFMSCGAKVPIYCMFAATLFSGYNQTLILFSIYMLGLVVAVLGALLLNKFVFRSEASTFIMELPQYRIPTLRSVLIHGWEKIKGFAIKAGTVIFGSTILIWLLSNFNINGMCEMEDSFLASIGNAVKIIFVPLGFSDWRASVGICTGWIAKENIVSTFGQLFGGITDESIIEGISDGSKALPEIRDVFNGASAYAYMAFNLLCMPCFAAVGAIRREMGSMKWTLRTILFQMATAYVAAFIIYQVGMLFI
ncbi:ferrous iron transport protein B [[Clostridium] polysaccharolyticum]|uniref:Ferrous iron transport protein B n=1 Tax=[Clostridium] polysaccharolyticum TaxID=29364 RepID=A0A1H9YWA6_9FIRM|nr:ferrous iron transport protein B [[Clostridium] polysaccharolyticum]SES73406.1 ferrous iron transport protein B [[Clostridium] polysaccharolyticum]